MKEFHIYLTFYYYISALAQVSRPGQERYLLFVFYVDIIYQNPQSDQPKFIAHFNFPIVILFKFRQTTSNGRAQVRRPAPALESTNHLREKERPQCLPLLGFRVRHCNSKILHVS